MTALRSKKAILDQLQDNHLGRVAATGADLDDAGIAAANALFSLASLVLGADFTHELLNHRIVYFLGALAIFALSFLVILWLWHIV